MKRVGIAGFLHESNSFSPIPTPYQHFKDTDLTRGKALLERWEFWEEALELAVELVEVSPANHAHRANYEALRARLRSQVAGG